MMRYIIFLLISFSTFGQELTVQGYVLDERGNPLPYSNIGIKNNAGGSFSDDRGYFKVKADTKDTLLISSIGYETRTILANIFKDRITLKTSVTILSEVQVKSKRLKAVLVELGYRKSKFTGVMLSNTQYSQRIQNETGKEGYIKDVYYKAHLSSSAGYNNGKVRIRVYQVDPLTGLPGEDLLHENVILNIEKKQKLVKTDISKYGIQIPRAGVYLGLDFLGFVDENGKLLEDSQKDIQHRYGLVIEYTNRIKKDLTFHKHLGTEWVSISQLPNSKIRLTYWINALSGLTVIFED